MKVAMMQPTFLPWQGYFELIYQADCFIFLNDFQFSVQSFHQRNRLFVNRDQIGWYTAVVDKKASFQCPLNETKMNKNLPWRKKLWKRIEQTYGKTPYFQTLVLFLKQWILTDHDSLADQNVMFIQYVCEAFGWKRKFLFSSAYASTLNRSQRVLELLKIAEGTTYYAAQGAFDYMSQDGIFPVTGIEVVFQQYKQVPYSQNHSNEFVPYLSVLDALCNLGVESTADLIIKGVQLPLTWQEMQVQHSSQ